MARTLRRYGYSNVYHIIFKGIDSQDIFYDDSDRKIFLKHLSITKKQFNNEIYAYCLMVNHVHLVIRIQNELLSKSMQSLLVRYVHYFNKKYQRTGTLVQNRFKSKNVENQKYFIDLCKYVHRNPENAGISKTQNYEWSSYKEYIGNAKIVDKNVLLHYFNNDINEFVKNTTTPVYNEYIDDYAEYEMIDRLTDQQLINIIMKKFEIKNISDIGVFFKNKTKDELQKDLEIIKNIKGTNLTQVARIIRISRKIISKICNM